MTLTAESTERDRAVGTLVAAACGDALGAGYEFGPSLAPSVPVAMIGGGLGDFAPGEWTDDTCMAVPIAQALAAGLDLRSDEGQDAIVAGWLEWFRGGPKDVGIQIGSVFRAAGGSTAAHVRAAAADHFVRKPDRSAGNGALMRTAPVGLANLPLDGIAEAARAVNNLTHADPVSAEACVIWSVAISHAVRHGTFDGVRLALDLLPPDRTGYWSARLDEAETSPAPSFSNNGWVVHALQAAWAAISQTPVPADAPTTHVRAALENAVRVGHDTDTVACIAGGLLGARWGASAIPVEWTSILHGWPGLRADDLRRLVAPDDESAPVPAEA